MIDTSPEKLFALGLRAAGIPLPRVELGIAAKEKRRRGMSVDTSWHLECRDVTLTQFETLMAEMENLSMRGRVIEFDLRRRGAEDAKWDVDLDFGYRAADRR